MQRIQPQQQKKPPPKNRKNHSKIKSKPHKPKNHISMVGRRCEHRKPVKRYKLFKSCEPRKPAKFNEKSVLGRPRKALNLAHKGNRRLTKPVNNSKALRRFKLIPRATKTKKSRQRKAYKPAPRIKLGGPKYRRRSNFSMMDVDDLHRCPSSDSSYGDWSGPIIVPRKMTPKRPTGFRALLARLFGLNNMRRPKPPPFLF